jgi:hypothetical protein
MAVAIVLLLVALAPFVGRTLAIEVTGAVATTLVLAFILPWQGWLGYLARVCALLGSVIGVVGAIQAFVAVGNDPGYSDRIPMDAAALVLALVAGVGGMLAGRYPARGSALVVFGGLAGGVAINLFYINTAYDLAVPFWLLSAFLFLARGIHTA